MMLSRANDKAAHLERERESRRHAEQDVRSESGLIVSRSFQCGGVVPEQEPCNQPHVDMMAEEQRVKRTLTEEAEKRKGESERARSRRTRINVGTKSSAAVMTLSSETLGPPGDEETRAHARSPHVLKTAKNCPVRGEAVVKVNEKKTRDPA
ncbi:hypothetical protein GBF38_020904 [Nibea albiflora]|uniref:Uncharacterized protein n=1 Tax=Nibea albiflora TaxID=240163 RepID=A0ACB7FEK7_NIBAL|nr:hypothetical protein GBF38_020904 [Nibea albiflora]